MPKLGAGRYFEDFDGVVLKILGGPITLHHDDFYTVRIICNPHMWNQAGRAWQENDTTMCAYVYIRDACRPIATVKFTHSDVPHGHCPECDEGEMIFYEGDYICAWCREHLEDAI